eukprot:TRINITY_DN362_c1_g1_i1.p1 TRINITY_DN362_c1_g1~~TRINITY_DN362_c1_g1_i1.p1  ORF type:complete len:351 (+),score=148.40 TRINITY_DN362_c1_g1_i1:60-1112(+)
MFGSFNNGFGGFPAGDLFAHRPQRAQRRSQTVDPMASFFGAAPARRWDEDAERAELLRRRRQQQQQAQLRRERGRDEAGEDVLPVLNRDELMRLPPHYRRAYLAELQEQREQAARRMQRRAAEEAAQARYQRAVEAERERAEAAHVESERLLREQQQQKEEVHNPWAKLFSTRPQQATPSPARSEASSSCPVEDATPDSVSVPAAADANDVDVLSCANTSDVAEADEWHDAEDAAAPSPAAATAVEVSGAGEAAVEQALVQINDIRSNGLASAEILEAQAFMPKTAENKDDVRKARLHYQEGLLQCVLKLDGVSTMGNLKVRAARREAVVHLEGMVGALQEYADTHDENL